MLSEIGGYRQAYTHSLHLLSLMRVTLAFQGEFLVPYRVEWSRVELSSARTVSTITSKNTMYEIKKDHRPTYRH